MEWRMCLDLPGIADVELNSAPGDRVALMTASADAESEPLPFPLTLRQFMQAIYAGINRPLAITAQNTAAVEVMAPLEWRASMSAKYLEGTLPPAYLYAKSTFVDGSQRRNPETGTWTFSVKN